jgi:hypothetical protein
LHFAQADSGSSTVLRNEFDASRFKSSTDHVECRSPRFVIACLKLADCDNAYAGTLCQIHLTPINQAARCSALRWGEHSSFL